MSMSDIYLFVFAAVFWIVALLFGLFDNGGPGEGCG